MIKYLRYMVATEYDSINISIREDTLCRTQELAQEQCDYLNKHSGYVYNVFKVTLERVDGNS